MKRTYLLIVALLIFRIADCQTKQFPTNRIEKLWLNELFCIDSSGVKKQGCSIDLDGFKVKFSSASYNRDTKKLHLIGRIPGRAGVGIYLSKTDTLPLKQALAYTKKSADINKDGYFDITLVVKPNQSLFFYNPNFFVMQYELYKLLNEQSLRK